MRSGPQLVTYPDSLGGDLRTLRTILDTRLAGVFGGVHVLPPFPSSGDRGFAPLGYEQIDPRFGTWDDIRALSEGRDVALDLIVNHVSRRSPEFADFERHGRSSPHADLFLTLDKLWPDGEPRPDEVARVHLRRPVPWSTFRIRDTGVTERVWTTFGRDDPSEQIDLDIRSPLARTKIERELARFAAAGVRIVRLDAVGYVAKRPGTSCFMVEPDVDEFVDWAASVARPLGLELLAEVHAPRETQRRLATGGAWAYDFVLPGLVLHTLSTRSAVALADHLATSPARQVTTLDTHDGIPIQPDLDDVLTLAEAKVIVRSCLARGANLSRILAPSQLRDPAFDAHQVNITYRSAVGDDDAYVTARAIQAFAPGIPQVYYVGLLGGQNDHDAVARTGEGRAINRHDYTVDEVDEALARPVVRRILRLFRLRHGHPAFGGSPRVVAEGARLEVGWSHGADEARLSVDLETRRAEVAATHGAGDVQTFEV